jgi:AcrR family transcriptional regulator
MSAPVAPRQLRKDAVRNREALVTAAHAAIREHGCQVDVREIARRAGVGMGTLYRHFPAKEDLVAEVLHEQFSTWAATTRAAAEATADPWAALTGFFSSALEGHSRRRALMESVALDRCDKRFAEDTAELGAIMTRLLTRAQQAGLIRPGVTPEDLHLILHALSSTVNLTESCCRPGAWRRTAQLTLDGLRADHQEPLPPAP